LLPAIVILGYEFWVIPERLARTKERLENCKNEVAYQKDKVGEIFQSFQDEAANAYLLEKKNTDLEKQLESCK